MTDTAERTRTIPLARPDVGPRELELVTQVMTSDVLAMGQFTERFEEAIAAQSNRAYGVACSSGTAGLHMAVRALGVEAGHEVITSPFSFVASVNCFLYEGAKPVFVDIEEDSLGLDPDQIKDVASKKTKAILPVQVFGRPCRIHPIVEQARDAGWAIIEDSCEALGSSVDGRPLGSFGDISVFAFYPNKQITTERGSGMSGSATTIGSTSCRPPSASPRWNVSPSSGGDATASSQPTSGPSPGATGYGCPTPDPARTSTGSSM
jgi:perosamine synthetase